MWPAAALSGSCDRSAAHVEVRIVDVTGAEVPRGIVGEVVARGENVMLGYWNRLEETEDAPVTAGCIPVTAAT